MLRAGRVGFTHAGNAPSWERLDEHACRVCGMYLFFCSSAAPNYVRRKLVSTRPDACAPRTHRGDLPQVATLRHRGSGVASSGHVLQAHGSDVLLRHSTYRLVAAARMLTVRSSADTRTNTARGRHLGPPRGRSPRRVYRWQKRARKTKRHSVRKHNHQSLHTLFADRNQRLKFVPPNAVHRAYRTKCAAKNPGDQSGPRSKRVDSMQTSSRSFLQQLQQKHTPRQKCTSAEDLASRKLPPWKMMCARTRRGRAQTQAQAKRRMS